MEAMWMRFNPAIQRVLEEVAAGSIGDVRTVQAGFGFPPPAGAIHWRPDLGGGALLDMGVYPLSFAHLLMGPPDRVEATGEMRDDGLDVTASVFLRYSDGRFAHALTSFAGPVDPVASVGGSRGVISLDAPFFFSGSYRVLTLPGFAVRPESAANEGRGYVPMFRAVSEAIADGLLEHPDRPLRDTIAVLETIDEVRRQLTSRG
jgi:predicted dehydrogenase